MNTKMKSGRGYFCAYNVQDLYPSRRAIPRHPANPAIKNLTCCSAIAGELGLRSMSMGDNCADWNSL